MCKLLLKNAMEILIGEDREKPREVGEKMAELELQVRRDYIYLASSFNFWKNVEI